MAAPTLCALILAGGSGTRLWPYSRRNQPKQLLPLLGDRSLLQTTLARLAPLVPPERVWVLTGSEHAGQVREQVPEVPPQQVVGEPEALGTAAAVGLGAAIMATRDAGALMAVLPADHVVRPEAAFLGHLVQASDIAASGHLVCFGIRPTRPATGFGYLELGAELPGHPAGRTVERFIEKPDLAFAAQLVATGRHLWNSGMFVWGAETILTEIRRYLPGLSERLDLVRQLAAGDDHTLAIRLPEIWSTIPDRTTIDFGVMERSKKVACVPVSFEWQDIGSWDALAEVLAPEIGDPAGNISLGGPSLGQDTRECLVLANGGRIVTTLGVTDLVVVDTPDAVLVCRRDRSEDVRDIVARLAAEGHPDLL